MNIKLTNDFNNYNIHNTSNHVSFGYDKKANKKLVKRLESDDSPAAFAVSDLNKLCNSLEDSILFLESKKTPKSYIDNIIKAFISTKKNLVEFVEQLYPELNFRDAEIQHYNIKGSLQTIDVDEYSDYWRFTLASILGNNAINKEEPCVDQCDDVENMEDIIDQIKVRGNVVSSSDPKEESLMGDIANSLKVIAQSLSSKVKEHNDVSTKNTELEVLAPYIATASSPKGFSSVGGMNELKRDLYDKIVYPIIYPAQAVEDFKEYGKTYPRAVIFHGPPGCGKTFMAQALSEEAKIPMFYLKIGKAGSEFINKTSKNYEKAFDEAAAKSKELCSPVILFIDEFEGLTKMRGSRSSEEDLKQLGTLLDLISGARDRNILVIAATNKFDLIDDAIRRRFDEQFYIGMPDEDAREEVLNKALEGLSKANNFLNDKSAVKSIAKKTQGFSNDDLCVIAKKALNIARLDGRRDLREKDFDEAIAQSNTRKIKETDYMPKTTRPSIGFSVMAEQK